MSIQHNHLHLIVEAESAERLARGMKAFQISAARRINAVAQRRGQVFSDRYHAVALRTPTQVRNAVSYCLNNWRHHGEGRSWPIDAYSTGATFDDWAEGPFALVENYQPLVTSSARTWLLHVGWKRAGTISAWEHHR